MKISKMVFSIFLITSFSTKITYSQPISKQPVYQDKPYLQDYSIRYYLPKENQNELKQAFADRNGNIKIYSTGGLLMPKDGQFLYPGTLVADKTYRTSAEKKIQGINVFDNQFELIDDKALFSNAWAGSLYAKHTLPAARIFANNEIYSGLISDGKRLQYLKDSKIQWGGDLSGDEILDIKFLKTSNQYYILGKKTLSSFSPNNQALTKLFEGSFTAFDITSDGKKAILGTTDGYLELALVTKKQIGLIHQKLPVTDITAIKIVNKKVWFGTSNGAFALNSNGKFDYYNGERWLPGNTVKHISEGPNNSILILTNAGLGQICFKNITLYEKAMFFEDQVRSRHIRNGFNASLDNMAKGDLASGYLADSDNDGLWTSMYLGGEIFRYAVTKEKEALQNCVEALDAMERLYTINKIPGFPSRSFERSGFISKLSDPERWQHSSDPEWDWKSTTSSDEAIGHVFAFGAMAEIIKDPIIKKRAITLIDTLVGHIVKNNYYLIDFDGKPTTWGRWNPEYVNAMPINVGDRKITSSNILSMLQTAYYFTKKPIYKEKAFELLNKHGYFENLMRPMKTIGYAPDDSDPLSKLLSDSWNHSDDEMYFVGYWGLYRYALNDTLKANYKKAIIDHWEIERPEKEGAWNIFTALTGTTNFDLNEAAWYLKEHQLDLIDWAIMNSHRKDIEKLAPNFRKQSIKEVLPPDERPTQRHNGNMFNLDRNRGNGTSEHSAGDIWLLPYWLGRYLGVISPPHK